MRNKLLNRESRLCIWVICGVLAQREHPPVRNRHSFRMPWSVTFSLPPYRRTCSIAKKTLSFLWRFSQGRLQGNYA